MKYIAECSIPDIKTPWADDIEELRKDAQKSDYRTNYGIDLHTSWVSERAIQFFRKHGYHVIGAEYFYFEPNCVMDIHIDGAYYCHKAKFNWATHKNHTFRFFEPIQDGVKDGVSDASSEYSWGFTDEQVILKQEEPMGTPSICCVGVPHQVINYDQPLELFNICVWKIGLKRDEDLGGMDMEDALKDFKEYVL